MCENLNTEQRNEKTMNLDEMTTIQLLQVMNEEDEQIPKIIKDQLTNINEAVQLVIHSFQNKGRLIYVGASTSRRLGILDTVECGPTFSSPLKWCKVLLQEK